MDEGNLAKNGGSAFPRQLPDVALPPDEALACIVAHAGMTLRDYFAARAMQGFVSHPDVLRAVSEGPRGHDVELAEAAYAMADAMLKARTA